MKSVFIAFTLKNSSVSEFFVCLANYLSRTHHVVLITHANEKHNLVIEDSIEIFNWPTNRPNSLKDLLFLLKLIQKYQPKTLIGNFAAVNLFMFGGFMMRVKNRIAWYHTLTTQLENKKLMRIRKRLFYNLATKIATNSEAGKQDLIKAFNIAPSKIEVINNAVRDPEMVSETEFGKIVFAGRLHKVKGVRVLMRAISLLKNEISNFKLVIIGEDEGTGELEELKKLRKELELEDYVNFLGNRSRNYVLKEFSSAYISVVPSFNEAFGYVVIESFSVGTPVIGSDSTGIATIIRDGKDGYLFRIGDDRDLADKLISILKDKKTRDKMSENCYRHFKEDYELKKVVKQLAKNPGIFN